MSIELMALRYGNKSASVKQVSDTFVVEMFENSRLVGTLRTVKLQEAQDVANEYISEGSKPQFLVDWFMDNETKEILCIAQEECAEVSQAISKIFRFGPDQIKYNQDKTNREHLEEEIGDLLCMVDILVQKAILSDWNINEARIGKLEKLKQWSSIKL